MRVKLTKNLFLELRELQLLVDSWSKLHYRFSVCGLFLGFLAVYSSRHMLHIILRSSELNLFALSYNILCISGYRWLKMVNNH